MFLTSPRRNHSNAANLQHSEHLLHDFRAGGRVARDWHPEIHDNVRELAVLQDSQIADIEDRGAHVAPSVFRDDMLHFVDHAWRYVRGENSSVRVQEFDLLADDSGAAGVVENVGGVRDGWGES